MNHPVAENFQFLWRILPQVSRRTCTMRLPDLRETIDIRNPAVVNLGPTAFWIHVVDESQQSQDSIKQFVIVVAGSLSRDRIYVAEAGHSWSCAL